MNLRIKYFKCSASWRSSLLHLRRKILVTATFILGTSQLFMSHAFAFWLLGFSDADTLPPGAVGAISGTGGQLTEVGRPTQGSFTPFLAHAGFRLGITDGFDVGYRLAQIALPFSSAGPVLGGELDARYRLTSTAAPWQASVVGGLAYSYLILNNVSKNAWSPGADLLLSHVLTPTYTFISELRYVYTEITSAPGGAGENYLHAAGVDIGMKIAVTRTVSLVPEMGLFNFTGRLAGRNADGIGFQYGAVLSFRFR